LALATNLKTISFAMLRGSLEQEHSEKLMFKLLEQAKGLQTLNIKIYHFQEPPNRQHDRVWNLVSKLDRLTGVLGKYITDGEQLQNERFSEWWRWQAHKSTTLAAHDPRNATRLGPSAMDLNLGVGEKVTLRKWMAGGAVHYVRKPMIIWDRKHSVVN
jgi:hypothetical protein